MPVFVLQSDRIARVHEDDYADKECLVIGDALKTKKWKPIGYVRLEFILDARDLQDYLTGVARAGTSLYLSDTFRGAFPQFHIHKIEAPGTVENFIDASGLRCADDLEFAMNVAQRLGYSEIVIPMADDKELARVAKKFKDMSVSKG